jgi:hypothetical protein
MKPLRRHFEDGYRLGTRLTLDHGQRRQLLRFFAAAPGAAGAPLTGRQAVAIAMLEGVGPVAIKHYLRGGLIRHINHCTYLNWPRTRSEKEFRWLETVRRIGIAAPQPIAFAATGGLFGQCWLVTGAIARPRSLIQLPPDDHRMAVYARAAAQVETLIRHGIWHRDLHPGNILVDEAGNPHIIDFDRARYLENHRLLRQRYSRRWKRAIVKHGLPAELAHVMTLTDAAA